MLYAKNLKLIKLLCVICLLTWKIRIAYVINGTMLVNIAYVCSCVLKTIDYCYMRWILLSYKNLKSIFTKTNLMWCFMPAHSPPLIHDLPSVLFNRVSRCLVRVQLKRRLDTINLFFNFKLIFDDEIPNKLYALMCLYFWVLRFTTIFKFAGRNFFFGGVLEPPCFIGEYVYTSCMLSR